MTWHTIRYDRIADLKAAWPCHGLPDDFDSLSVETDEKGDIVDLEAYVNHPDGSNEQLDWREFDGPALKALVDDCVEFGDISDETSPTTPSAASYTSPAL
ncbi:hypothetical protein O9X98_10250 [Agrobacterium salinitolerans]|nr:hypothetical protein [Agrobacterium salinitolerans]